MRGGAGDAEGVGWGSGRERPWRQAHALSLSLARPSLARSRAPTSAPAQRPRARASPLGSNPLKGFMYYIKI